MENFKPLARGRFADLTGERFGRLFVLKRGPNISLRKAAWLCQCDCGNKKVIGTQSLKRKRQPTRSCGCLRSELTAGRNRSNTGPFLQRAEKDVWCHYITNARNGNREWRLTRQQFHELIGALCYWCGDPPANELKIKGRTETFWYQGIDRLDNQTGYLPDNVVSCCFPCNKLKRSLSVHDFETRVQKIARRMECRG